MTDKNAQFGKLRVLVLLVAALLLTSVMVIAVTNEEITKQFYTGDTLVIYSPEDKTTETFTRQSDGSWKAVIQEAASPGIPPKIYETEMNWNDADLANILLRTRLGTPAAQSLALMTGSSHSDAIPLVLTPTEQVKYYQKEIDALNAKTDKSISDLLRLGQLNQKLGDAEKAAGITAPDTATPPTEEKKSDATTKSLDTTDVTSATLDKYLADKAKANQELVAANNDVKKAQENAKSVDTKITTQTDILSALQAQLAGTTNPTEQEIIKGSIKQTEDQIKTLQDEKKNTATALQTAETNQKQKTEAIANIESQKETIARSIDTKISTLDTTITASEAVLKQYSEQGLTEQANQLQIEIDKMKKERGKLTLQKNQISPAAQTPPTGWEEFATAIASIVKSYDQYAGLGKVYGLFYWGNANTKRYEAWLSERRTRVFNELCDAGFVGEIFAGKQCIQSKICEKQTGTMHRETASAMRTTSGGVYIRAERTPAYETPNGLERIYKIEYRAANPSGEENKYNVQLKASNGNVYEYFDVSDTSRALAPGASAFKAGQNMLVFRSRLTYNIACLAFDHGILKTTGEKRSAPICVSFTDAGAAPSSYEQNAASSAPSAGADSPAGTRTPGFP
jgi:chemotaxis protein histidine kinase CheA